MGINDIIKKETKKGVTYKMHETYMIIIFHANGEEHIRSKNKDYLVTLHDKLEKRGIESYVVKTAGKVN